jgi:hypothetical protein
MSMVTLLVAVGISMVVVFAGARLFIYSRGVLTGVDSRFGRLSLAESIAERVSCSNSFPVAPPACVEPAKTSTNIFVPLLDRVGSKFVNDTASGTKFGSDMVRARCRPWGLIIEAAKTSTPNDWKDIFPNGAPCMDRFYARSSKAWQYKYGTFFVPHTSVPGANESSTQTIPVDFTPRFAHFMPAFLTRRPGVYFAQHVGPTPLVEYQPNSVTFNVRHCDGITPPTGCAMNYLIVGEKL